MRRLHRSWFAREGGAATLEYVAMIVGASVLISGLFLVVVPAKEPLMAKVCQVFTLFGVECDAQAGGEPPDSTTTGPKPKEDEDYQPDACMYHEESEKFSGEVKVWFLTFGTNSGFIVQQYADGKVRVTATDGGSLGASVGAGGKFDTGKLGDGKNSGLDVDFGGGLKFEYGDTWEFKSMDEYDKFHDQLDNYLMQQQMLKQEGGVFAIKAMGGFEDPPPVPQTQMASIGVDLSLKAAFGLKDPTGKKDSSGKDQYFDPNAGVNAEIAAGTKAIVKNNLETGDTTWTYDVHASGQAGVEMVLGGGSAKGSTSGAFSITRDAKGNVTKIVFQTTREGSLEGHLGNNKSLPGGGKAGVTESSSSVVSTVLEVNDSNRDVVDDWLASTATYGEAARLALPWESMIPDSPSSNPFEQLLYEEAKVSSVEYHNVKNKQEFGLNVKIGFKVGFGLSMEEATADAVDATYLGAPGPDGVRVVVPDTECVP